ncbi:hypothetical protein SAMN04487970_102914 [Paenibacillus tianmuensis]|uniref:Uncharacterized protein n=1 Tax=Paenibacillus tianmuensis TaxID=624147 RepID=A0A1G4SHW8_9BACL|nr:hypothetical protein SAMN04487970_102914 [Paenibacillus tianmuensis]
MVGAAAATCAHVQLHRRVTEPHAPGARRQRQWDETRHSNGDLLRRSLGPASWYMEPARENDVIRCPGRTGSVSAGEVARLGCRWHSPAVLRRKSAIGVPLHFGGRSATRSGCRRYTLNPMKQLELRQPYTRCSMTAGPGLREPGAVSIHQCCSSCIREIRLRDGGRPATRSKCRRYVATRESGMRRDGSLYAVLGCMMADGHGRNTCPSKRRHIIVRGIRRHELHPVACRWAPLLDPS